MHVVQAKVLTEDTYRRNTFDGGLLVPTSLLPAHRDLEVSVSIHLSGSFLFLDFNLRWALCLSKISAFRSFRRFGRHCDQLRRLPPLMHFRSPCHSSFRFYWHLRACGKDCTSTFDGGLLGPHPNGSKL